MSSQDFLQFFCILVVVQKLNFT